GYPTDGGPERARGRRARGRRYQPERHGYRRIDGRRDAIDYRGRTGGPNSHPGTAAQWPQRHDARARRPGRDQRVGADHRFAEPQRSPAYRGWRAQYSERIPAGWYFAQEPHAEHRPELPVAGRHAGVPGDDEQLQFGIRTQFRRSDRRRDARRLERFPRL